MTNDQHGLVFNPFACLGLEPRMDIRVADIDAAYRRAVGGAHPDLGVPDPDGDELGLEGVELINEARRVLLDPETRARAIFALLSGSVSPGATAANDDALPDGFLMQIMETRMEIEAELSVDRDSSPAERETRRVKWEDWAHAQRAEAVQTVSDWFARVRAASDEPGKEAALSECRRALNAWRYIERLIEQLDPEHSGLD